MNDRLGRGKFDSLRIIIDSGSSSYIIIGKHAPKLRKKITKPFRWSTQGGDFNTNSTSKVEIVLPGIDEMKSMTWNFHVDDLQGTHRYDMKPGSNI